MVPDFYTFLEITKFNSHDWDRAYEVLTCYVSRGDFIKELRGPEDIIYRNVGGIAPFDLIHQRVFLTQPVELRKRPRIKRINSDIY